MFSTLNNMVDTNFLSWNQQKKLMTKVGTTYDNFTGIHAGTVKQALMDDKFNSNLLFAVLGLLHKVGPLPATGPAQTRTCKIVFLPGLGERVWLF